MKRIRIMFLTLLAVSIFTFLPASDLKAAKPKFGKETLLYRFQGEGPDGGWGYDFGVENMSSKDKITKVVSSNSKVFKVYPVNDRTAIGFDIKKAGKAKITCVIKRGKKRYKISTNVTIRNYKNPLAKLSIGNKNLTTLFSNDINAIIEPSIDKYQGKLSVKAAKGWKIVSIDLDTNGDNKTKTVRNGSNIRLNKKSVGFLKIRVKNIKYKYYDDLYISY